MKKDKKEVSRDEREKTKKRKFILIVLLIYVILVIITLTCVSLSQRHTTSTKNIAKETTTEEFITTETTIEVDTTKEDTTEAETSKETTDRSEQSSPKEMYWRTKGNIVSFGSYEQDNNLENGAENIEWIIIDVTSDNDTILLISKLCLDYIPYRYIDISEGYSQFEDFECNWIDSDLREWLNHSFYQSAFSEEEKEQMLRIDLEYTLNNYDNVTILTASEANEMKQNNISLFANDTPYAVAHQNLLMELPGFEGFAYDINHGANWWLRKDEASLLTDYVFYNNLIDSSLIVKEGTLTISPTVAVRPVIKIKLS